LTAPVKTLSPPIILYLDNSAESAMVQINWKLE